jgi:hypothetical protein
MRYVAKMEFGLTPLNSDRPTARRIAQLFGADSTAIAEGLVAKAGLFGLFRAKEEIRVGQQQPTHYVVWLLLMTSGVVSELRIVIGESSRRSEPAAGRLRGVRIFASDDHVYQARGIRAQPSTAPSDRPAKRLP